MAKKTPTERLSEREAARRLGVAPSTLLRWRRAKEGPAHTMLGRRAVYLQADLDAFLAARRVDDPIASSGPAEART